MDEISEINFKEHVTVNKIPIGKQLFNLSIQYSNEVEELKDSLGADMPLIESQKLTKIAYFELFIEELDNILSKEQSNEC